MFTAGPPIAPTRLSSLGTAGGPFFFRRHPESPSCKPAEHHAGIPALQLPGGWQELLAVASTKGRGLVVNENGPVRESRRHNSSPDLGLSLEPLDLFDERRPLHVEQSRRPSLVSVGPLERAPNQFTLDAGQVSLQIQTIIRQHDWE